MTAIAPGLPLHKRRVQHGSANDSPVSFPNLHTLLSSFSHQTHAVFIMCLALRRVKSGCSGLAILLLGVGISIGTHTFHPISPSSFFPTAFLRTPLSSCSPELHFDHSTTTSPTTSPPLSRSNNTSEHSSTLATHSFSLSSLHRPVILSHSTLERLKPVADHLETTIKFERTRSTLRQPELESLSHCSRKILQTSIQRHSATVGCEMPERMVKVDIYECDLSHRTSSRSTTTQ